MSTKTCRSAVVLAALGFIILVSCSSNSTDSSNLALALTKYTELIEQIAPPRFQGSEGLLKPAIMDSVWLYGYGGENPLLGKVFGEDEPMSLYSNLETLDDAIETINDALASLEESIEDAADNEEETPTDDGWVDIQELDSPVNIPEQCQPVLGESAVELDYRLTYHWSDIPDGEFEAGFQKTDSTETVLCYRRMPWTGNPDYPNQMTSFVFYAHRHLQTDSVLIKSVYFSDMDENTQAIWVYEIRTVGESDFQYRMTWFANEEELVEGMLGCIIGGGDKDVEFALRYREYCPLDQLNRDIDQLFGPNYTDEGEVTAGFDDYIDPDNFYAYEDLPTDLLTNPLDVADLINPWNGQ
jgi:hypothetical protein